MLICARAKRHTPTPVKQRAVVLGTALAVVDPVAVADPKLDLNSDWLIWALSGA